MRSILELCRPLNPQAFEAGSALLTEGGSNQRLYVLISGEVEICKGDLQINVVSDPGALFGETSVLLGTPNMATVRARMPCQVHVIEVGEAFLQSHQNVSYQVCRLLAQRLYGLTTYLADLKSQFARSDDHLSMIDDVLESLIHRQAQSFSPGSDRDPEI